MHFYLNKHYVNKYLDLKMNKSKLYSINFCRFVTVFY